MSPASPETERPVYAITNLRTFAALPVGAYFVPITGTATKPSPVLLKIAAGPVAPTDPVPGNVRQLDNLRRLGYCPDNLRVVEIEMPGPDCWILEIRPCEVDEKQKQLKGVVPR